MTAVDHPGHPAPPMRPELPDGVEAQEPWPQWSPWSAFVAMVAGFAAALVGALVIGGVAGISGSDFQNPPPAVNIISTLFQDACLIGSALLFARLSRPPKPWQFGLRPTHLWRAVAWVVVAYVGFILFSFVWLSITGETSAKDNLPKELGAKDSTAALLGVTFLVTIVAPLAEEFFFRGFFYGALRNWRGVWPAAVITGCVFGAIHGGSSPVVFLVPLAFFGIALCLLRERTGSLYPCIALHCINNSIALGSSMKWGWEIPVAMASALSVIAAILFGVQRFAGRPPARALPASA